MKITLTQTTRASENGFAVKRFESGETYEVMDTCARKLIRDGYAIEAKYADPVDAAAERQEMKNIVSGTLQPWEIQAQIMNAIQNAFDRREPTNPATREAIGKPL